MQLEVTRDPAAIVALVEPLLAADPVRNTVFSSVIAGLQGPDADGWCAHPAGDPSVLAVRSQRHTPVVVTAGWHGFVALADAIAMLAPVAALAGPISVVDALTVALGDRGLPSTARTTERLFRLDELTEPAGVPGKPRIAEFADREFLADWYESFTIEVFGALAPGQEANEFVSRLMHRSSFWVWTGAEGAVRAMAGRHPVVNGVARIGPVYTPPAQRGHGYGSGVTAAATRHILDDGAVPVLFTDLANPTSNKIYRQLGYYPVEDRARVSFS